MGVGHRGVLGGCKLLFWRILAQQWSSMRPTTYGVVWGSTFYFKACIRETRACIILRVTKPSEILRQSNHRRPPWLILRSFASAANYLQRKNKVPTRIYKERDHTAEGLVVLRTILHHLLSLLFQ